MASDVGEAGGAAEGYFDPSAGAEAGVELAVGVVADERGRARAWLPVSGGSSSPPTMTLPSGSTTTALASAARPWKAVVTSPFGAKAAVQFSGVAPTMKDWRKRIVLAADLGAL